MKDESYLNKLESVLRKDERLIAEDGRLLKVKIAELARALDPELIKLILNEKELKKLFFTKIDSVLIFDKDKFVTFVENEAFLPDSYTSYKNKVGLATDRNDFISDRNEVVLNWPYKDCVLEGGQDKEDQKRNETFWNEILGADQRDVLLAPKVLTGFKRYDKDGEHNTTEIKENDNLIIKGNNLLALYTLKKRYAGKVKLIYIDPPYNTGNDGFNYNDNFNHSTWLTFMKNRLQVAKELLRDDGVIFIQCDDNEQAYLKVLMDEIFGRENYRNSIYWHRTYAGKTISKNLPWNVDTILFYSKNPKSGINNITKELTEVDIASFTKDDNDGRGKYGTVSLQKTGGPGPQTSYDYIDNKKRIWKCPIKGWRMTKEKLKALENDGRLYITDKTIRQKYYLNERIEIGKQIDNLWNDIGNMNRSKGEDTGFAGQKPEKLIQRIADLTTKSGDIILDFFIGSGTTCAVAHKMGRQYIGIEQLYYGDIDSIERLRDVIKGDQSGISNNVGWKSGGSFVFAHLKNDVNVFIEAVKDAKTNKELLDLLRKVRGSNFLSYRVDLEKLNEDEFGKLPEEHKKRLLIELVDKNKLYVNYHDIDDESYKIDTNTKKLNHWLQTRNKE